MSGRICGLKPRLCPAGGSSPRRAQRKAEPMMTKSEVTAQNRTGNGFIGDSSLEASALDAALGDRKIGW